MVKEKTQELGRKKIKYQNVKNVCFEDINFDIENGGKGLESVEFVFKCVHLVRFVNCSFNNGLKLSGSCDAVEFENCVGNVVSSDFSAIKVEVRSCELNFEKIAIHLLRNFNIYDNSTVYIKGPIYFTASSLCIFNESEVVIQTAKAFFDHVSLYGNSVITLDDSFDNNYPDLKKICNQNEEKVTCIYIMECGCNEGYLRSINNSPTCINGHFVTPEDKKECDRNGFYKNMYMSIAYHFS